MKDDGSQNIERPKPPRTSAFRLCAFVALADFSYKATSEHHCFSAARKHMPKGPWPHHRVLASEDNDGPLLQSDELSMTVRSDSRPIL